MPLTPKHVFAAVALCATAACIDMTQPQYRVSSHSLLAYTNSMTAGDSIECTVYASLPLVDSIQTPWTGTVPPGGANGIWYLSADRPID